jgi:hypothetical protein
MNRFCRLLCFSFISVSQLSSLSTASSQPIKVTLSKEASGWVMRVDGQPFYIKGVSCNDGMADGVDYLALVAGTGANTVRLYGDATQEYLDLAQKHGLKVNVGFWTNAIRLKTKESYRDLKYTADLKRKALALVRQFKDHPAVLTWTMGNETFIFTEKEEEREAYGRFLEDLVQAIHQEDPNHPVIYSSSYTRCLPYLKRLVPSIDIVGVNVTGGAGGAIAWAQKNDFDRPVIVTEFAPLGAWEMRKDPNDQPYDQFDHLKAEMYTSSWRQMQANPQACIGGFAFVMGGFRNQDSLTWYNMNYGELKRWGYWTVHEIYTGKKPENRPPKITNITVDPIQKLKRGNRTTLKLTAADAENDPLTYDYFITNIANDPLIVEKPTFYPADPQSSEPGVATLQVPKKRGIYRIYGKVNDGQGNTAIADRTIQVK